MVASLAVLADLAAAHSATVLTGRSHNVPAQATTLGKRFANAGQELLQEVQSHLEVIRAYLGGAQPERDGARPRGDSSAELAGGVAAPAVHVAVHQRAAVVGARDDVGAGRF